jgi:multidrug resistance efflux pump
MSRHAGMSPRARRGWAIGLIAFFVVMCAAIAVSQWWAIHKNVPYYERQTHAGARNP